MALKAIIDTLESIDEAQRSLYRKVDAAGDPLVGKFILDVEAVDGYLLAPVENLKSALSTERALREKAEGALKAFEGINPCEARTLRADLARLGALDPHHHADLLAAEKAEAAKAELRREAAARAEEVERRHDRLLDRLRDLLLTGPAMATASRLGGNRVLLLPIVVAQTRVRELASGEVVVEVLDRCGVARVKDASGNLMTVEDLIVEMSRSDEFRPLFESAGSSPGGLQAGNGGGATGGNPWRKESWNVTEQMKLMIKAPQTADRLRREAGVTSTERNPWRRDQWNVTAQHSLTRVNPVEAARLQREAFQ